MSQASVGSSASTIPPSIFYDDDDEFIEEVSRVNDLYFGNIEVNQNEINETLPNESDENDSDNDTEINNNECIVELSDTDLKELENLGNFFDKSCGCVRLYGEPCSKRIDTEILTEYRNNCLETSKNELDIMIKIQLFHHRNNSTETESKKHKSKEREKVRQKYYFNGNQVCRDTFAFAHGVGRKTVDRIARSLDQDGLIPRVHGNKGKLPKHALTVGDVEMVKKFITTFANKNGLPLPGRLPNYRNEKTLLLPSDKTKAEIHQDYLKAAEESEYRLISLSQFKAIWLEQCPHILIMKPSTDLCNTCQSYTNSLRQGGNLSEEEKEQLLEKYTEHVQFVKMQRDHYRSQCDDAKTVFSSLTCEEKVRGKPSCSNDSMFHYSFDYAQQVHYPHYAQQVGPLFFKTPRKCQCFGISSEGSGTQIFYLVDESQHANKGANAVTSMLHHHFSYLGYGETDVKLHMDNCSGQNKNNTVIGYGLWRVLTGKHKSVEFSMMEAGHTKFNPDWHFGLWKVKWRHSTVETLAEMAETVRRSSRNGHNIPQLVDDPVAPVHFYNWAQFMKTMFKPIPALKSYHHFRMNIDHPGIVFAREYAESPEIALKILKQGLIFDLNSMPDLIPAKGLDAQRQWYLYEEVAPYCVNTESCPRPDVPKPIIKLNSSSPAVMRKCSRCKQTGHTRPKCPNKATQ